jgi:RNA polymerase sigma-70 factor (ECF subfamily)
MVMRDITLSDVDRLEAKAGETDETLQMDEETFRALYERTARALWVYLSRMTNDTQLADDLLQETYYRFLRTGRTYVSDSHRRNYLFRIATNLVRDRHRRHRADPMHRAEAHDVDGPQADDDVAERAHRRADLTRAMMQLKARDRELLWLAYAQGSSHREIADVLGLKVQSVKLMLFRARRRLARLLRGGERTARR